MLIPRHPSNTGSRAGRGYAPSFVGLCVAAASLKMYETIVRLFDEAMFDFLMSRGRLDLRVKDHDFPLLWVRWTSRGRL